jgi:hypothetical protein
MSTGEGVELRVFGAAFAHLRKKQAFWPPSRCRRSVDDRAPPPALALAAARKTHPDRWVDGVFSAFFRLLQICSHRERSLTGPPPALVWVVGNVAPRLSVVAGVWFDGRIARPRAELRTLGGNRASSFLERWVRPMAAVAAKRRDSSAQGNALGPRYMLTILALKGRDPSLNADRSHPVGVPQYDGDADPGRCPALMSVTPSGSIIASKAAGEKAGRSPEGEGVGAHEEAGGAAC